MDKDPKPQNPEAASGQIQLAELITQVNLQKREYSQSQDISKLEEAINIIEASVQASNFSTLPAESRSMLLTRLGVEYFEKHVVAGDETDLELGLQSIDQAVDIHSDGDSIDPEVVDTIAIVLRNNPRLPKTEIAVRKAISIHHVALSLAPAEDADQRASTLTNTANAYKMLHEITSSPDDIDVAIELNSSALDLIGEDSTISPGVFSNLGNAHTQRFRQSGDWADIDRAVENQLAAIRLLEHNEDADPDETALINFALGTSLQVRFSESKNLQDADDAIERFVVAFRGTPRTSDQYVPRLASLGSTLRLRAQLTNSIEDIDSSLSIFGVLEAQSDPGSESHSGFVNELAIASRRKYEIQGSLEALERALIAQVALVEMMPDASPDKMGEVADLSVLYSISYLEMGYFEHLIKARDGFNRALSLNSPDLLVRPRVHHNLANALGWLWEATGNGQFLDESYQHRLASIDLTEDGSNELAVRLAGLAQDSLALYQRTKARELLDDAVDRLELAASLDTQTEIDHANILYMVARLLALKYEEEGDEKDRASALEHAREATLIASTSSNAKTFSIAGSWGYWASNWEDWEEAIEAFTHALQASDGIYESQHLRRHKLAKRRESIHVYQYAAYAFAKGGRLEDAVMSLERGRAKLLAEQLQSRDPDIDALRSINSELEGRYSSIRQGLAALDSASVVEEYSGLPPESHAMLLNLQSQANSVLDEIREIEGFQEFMKPIQFEQVAQAASMRTLVYFVLTHYGGLALVVDGNGTIEVVWLEALKSDALENYLRQVSLAFYKAQDPDEAFLKTVDEICSWLGSMFMREVWNYLEQRGIDEVALIPQGLLGALPLHAAWVDDIEEPSERLYAQEKALFTYTPSASALVAANAQRKGQMQSVFVVEDPTCDLVFAPMEAATVLGQFQHGEILGGLSATKAAVLDRIDSANVLHFCGHSSSDPLEPLNSALEMANDELLTLADISDLDFDETDLVVLSGCETGLIGRELPDEVIGFPGGLLSAGVPAVIASIWAVDDHSTSVLMETFYENAFSKGLHPAEALRRAQIDMENGKLSDADLSAPYYWASFYFSGI